MGYYYNGKRKEVGAESFRWEWGGAATQTFRIGFDNTQNKI